MKYLRIFLILLLIPFIVLAEECDVSNIAITSMKPNKIEGNTEVISDPTFEDRTINLNLKMYDVNDSITYDMTIKNDSKEDYMIDEDTFKTDSDYIEYTLKTKDNTNIVKANSTKEVSLIVTYKKEVDDSLLTNNKFNASNSLKLSLNTSEKEQPLDTITTDNIKEVKNPVTSVSSMMLISIILLTSIVILYILIKRRNKYTKYLLILLSMILIPTVYAICKCDIEVESTIEIEKKKILYDTVVGLSNEENTCITKYEGKVTDELNKTVDATNVYFNKCTDKRNIIFGGFCWQMLRTNDTKGIRMIYNGEPVDGKCLSNREDHKGIVAKNTNYTINLNNNYLYGSSFTYDITNKTFKLQNTENMLWSDDTYTNILGKYTCLSDSDTCSTIYSVSDYYSNTKGYYNSYIIDDTNYASIGTSSYNANDETLNAFSYMFNKTTPYNEKKMSSTDYLYGSSYTYNSDTDTYTITGETQIIGDWQTGYDKLNNTHYTCWNTPGKCKKINFLFHTGYAEYTNYTFSSAIYIQLTKGKTVNEVVNELFYNEDLNKYNSTVKSYLENWYANNLLSYNNYIEDNVYCNDIKIIDARGFEENGVLTHRALLLDYSKEDISCNNQLHQFHTANNKAKLKYPINLLKDKEYKIISYPNNYDLFTTGKRFWVTIGNLLIDDVGRSGTINNMWYFPFSSAKSNIRPVISLKPGVTIINGTGSEEDPWIIE